MQTFDITGSRLTPKLFIEAFRMVWKLYPPRFLTLRLHPDRYKDIYVMADVPESIQIGSTPAPLGKKVMRVNCVKPPMGVADGIALLVDEKADPTKLEFQVHGVPEFYVVNIFDDTPSL